MTARNGDDNDEPLQTIRRKLNPVPWPRRVHWLVCLFAALLVLNLVVLIATLAH